jgi:biotin carboxylase
MGGLRHVVVIGLNDFHRARLATLTRAAELRFHGVLAMEDVTDAPSYDMPALLSRAEREIRALPFKVDAVVSHYDFPASTMLPILCRRLGLPTPSLESVLKCEHKYWSRLEQHKVIPDRIPPFCLVDPFDPEAKNRINLPFPFWLKPVKSLGSYLGHRIDSAPALERALGRIRAHIARLAEPFDLVLEHAVLPPEIAQVTGRHCIAEGYVTGKQCTLEGYVFDGAPHVYGIVDSLRYPNGSSFERYQYPSRLPRSVQRRMIDTADAVLRQIGLDRSAFDMEFFYDEPNDRIWSLEINPRISQSHCVLFERVHGASHQEVMVDLALGRRPDYPPAGEGPFKVSAKFMLRETRDGIVAGVPSADKLARIERSLPGTVIQLNVAEGVRLAHLEEQDSYMYQIAEIYTAGNSVRELVQKYRACVESLGIRLVEPSPSSLARGHTAGAA